MKRFAAPLITRFGYRRVLVANTVLVGASMATFALAWPVVFVLTAGTALNTTVLPFILRGVKVLGIESSMCPMSRRLETWRRVATDLKPWQLKTRSQVISLDDLPMAFDTLLKGQARGRFIVNLQR